MAAVYLLVLAGVVAQAWPGLWRAQLMYDDSALFARSFQRFSLADWVEPYMGYRSVLGSAMASLLCTLPARWIPFAYALATVGIAARSAGELLYPRWSGVASWSARALTAVAVAWLPLGSFALSTCLSFAQWYALFWLGLVLLRPPLQSSSGFRVACEFVLVAILVWSHPLSVALSPVAFFVLWQRGPQRRAVAAVFLIAAGGYLASVSGGHAELHPCVAAGELVPLLLERVLFESWFGTAASRWLYQSGLGWIVTVGGVAMLLAAYRMLQVCWGRWSHDTRCLVAGLLFGATFVTAACLLVRGGAVGEAGWWGHRYLSFGRWAWVTTTVLVVTTQVSRRVVLVLLASWAIATWCGNHRFYRVQRPPSELRAFLLQIEAEQQRLGDRRLVEAHLDRGDWPIHITPKPVPK